MPAFEPDDRDYSLLREMTVCADKNFIFTADHYILPRVFFTPDEKRRRVETLKSNGYMAGEIGKRTNGESDYQGINVTDDGKSIWKMRILLG
jgi:hypothetical protein